MLLAVEEAAGLKALSAALASGHDIVAVLTTATESRGSSAWRLAQDQGLTLADPTKLRQRSFAASIRSAEIDLLINVHSLHIAAADVVAAPTLGSFNLHPGPLPEYRGLNAPSWAIYDDREEHAVTVHWMTADVDAGPVAYESRFPIDPEDTGLTLSSRCVERGIPLIKRLLEDAGTGAIPRLPQPEGPSSHHGREAPNDGWVDWTQPASRIAAHLRASDFRPLPSPWGLPKARLNDTVIELAQARANGDPSDRSPGRIEAASDEGVWVATGAGSLQVLKVKIDGRTRPATEVLAPGQDFSLDRNRSF